MNPQMGGDMNMTPMAPQDQGGDMPQQAQSMARTERERGPALDLSKGVDAAVVRSKITEIACLRKQVMQRARRWQTRSLVGSKRCSSGSSRPGGSQQAMMNPQMGGSH